MRSKQVCKKVFTLVELMCAVAVIGILATIAIPNFMSMQLKTKQSERVSMIGMIRDAELAYRQEWGAYWDQLALNPPGAPSSETRRWQTSADNSVYKGWEYIGVKPDGNMLYGSYSGDLDPSNPDYIEIISRMNLDDSGVAYMYYINDSGNVTYKIYGSQW